MKKKGLIVATIVMVLVLAVSLTTATYAWFSVEAQTTIEAISFSVGTGSDVSIGLKADNTYENGASAGAFVFGTTYIESGFATSNVPNGTIPTAGDTYWGGDAGLGNAIDMQLDLSNMEKAVGTGKVSNTAGVLDFASLRTVATDTVAGVVMAEGSSSSIYSASTVERAYAQQHYLDVVIGVQAAATDLNKIICNVTINPDESDIDLGMNAAIHVAWKINGDITEGADGSVDVYGAHNKYYSTTTASLLKTLVGGNTNTVAYGGTTAQVLNDGAVNLAIPVADAGKDGETFLNIDREDIYQIHLVIWIDGTDSDCINQALGVGSTIYINFSTEHPNRVDA